MDGLSELKVLNNLTELIIYIRKNKVNSLVGLSGLNGLTNL